MKKMFIFIILLFTFTISSCSKSTYVFNENNDCTISNSLFLDTNYVLVNKCYKLDDNYIPNNLISIKEYSPFRDIYLQPKARDSILEFIKESRYEFYIFSGYRSYNRQSLIYTSSNNNSLIALPGHSEHQTGLAVDISTKQYGLSYNLGLSTEGDYIKENAHKYGFILRYPENKSDITGYDYEPWHLRYVGKIIAYSIYSNKLTLEEYLDTYKNNSILKN